VRSFISEQDMKSLT